MTSTIKHLAIIMDGNRRWAKSQGLPSIEGHRVGYDKLHEVSRWCIESGIRLLTVFAFSTENWKRTQEEVGYLMDLIERALTKEIDRYMEEGVRIKVVGRREGLRPSIIRAIDDVEARTANNTTATLALCINYGGRPEIIDACKAMIDSGVKSSDITEESFAHHLYWPDMPDPDLIIRTSGEERLSGFLTWQSAYSELFWSQKHWPEFDRTEFDRAIEVYAERERRYGT